MLILHPPLPVSHTPKMNPKLFLITIALATSSKLIDVVNHDNHDIHTVEIQNLFKMVPAMRNFTFMRMIGFINSYFNN